MLRSIPLGSGRKAAYFQSRLYRIRTYTRGDRKTGVPSTLRQQDLQQELRGREECACFHFLNDRAWGFITHKSGSPILASVSLLELSVRAIKTRPSSGSVSGFEQCLAFGGGSLFVSVTHRLDLFSGGRSRGRSSLGVIRGISVK